MAIGRVMHENVVLFPDFDEIVKKIGYDVYHSNWEMQLFLQIPNLTKVDILEYFEHFIMDFALNGDGEVDSIFMVINKGLAINSPNPTYISEYINVVGQLFLVGYIEFGMCGLQDKEENLLSKQKPDKYQSWIYFRNNFIYTGFFNRSPEDEIYIYNGKEYNEANCPTCIKDGVTTLCGYNAMYGSTSWDTPRYWSQYNVLLVRTQKAIDCMDILDGKIYHKYKDLEVEIDDKGNIIKWIGQINR